MRWAWDQLEPWIETRRELPIGALLCVIHGPTAGRHWEASAARKQLHHAAAATGCPTAIRAAPATPRTRGRNGARRRPARRYPTPTRACQPRHHQHLSPRHRQQRNHRHRQRTAITNDLRDRRPPDQALATTSRVGRTPGPTRHTLAWRRAGDRVARGETRIRARAGREVDGFVTACIRVKGRASRLRWR